MTQLLVVPTYAGYAAHFGSSVISTKLDGGASRYRLDKIGSTHNVQVQWMLTSKAYTYLMAFYRTEIDFGSLPFTIYLSLDGSSSALYTARIVPGTLKLNAYLATLFQVSAALEITPQAVNETADQVLITAGPV